MGSKPTPVPVFNCTFKILQTHPLYFFICKFNIRFEKKPLKFCTPSPYLLLAALTLKFLSSDETKYKIWLVFFT